MSEKMSFADSIASARLDALRAIAAILVLLEHWRNIFFVDFGEVHNGRWLWALIYSLAGLGHQAVIIFFVLSGFLISGTIVRSISGSRWSWRKYFTHRLVRLWLVLLPALLMGFVCDQVGIHLNQAPMLYSGLSGNHVTPDVASNSSLVDFIGNALFLQTIIVPALGSNGALWSLANEWWYYVMFPLAACVIGRVYRSPLANVACIAIFVLIFSLIGRNILFLFPAWLCGAVLNILPVSRTRTNAGAFAAGIIIYSCTVAGCGALQHRSGQLGTFVMPAAISDTVLALATMGLVWLILCDSRRAQNTLSVRWSRATAKFSYSLYVTHTPLLVFFAATLAHGQRWIPGRANTLIACALLAVAVAYAWLFACVTEFKTDSVREWIERWVLR